MVAAARYGTVTLRTAKRTFHKEIFISDVDSSRVRWDAGDGASSTSPEYFIPEVNMAIIDISLASGLTDTHKMQLTIRGKTTGDYFTYANHINTLSERVRCFLPVPAEAEVTFIQKAN